MKELDLKLTLGMAERRLTESPPDEESWRGGQWFKSRPDPKSPSHGVWLFLVQSVTIPVEHSSDVKQRPKTKRKKEVLTGPEGFRKSIPVCFVYIFN